MAKELPYFKFITSEWLDGEITIEDLETQGLFINICALYWSKEGRLSFSKIKKRFRFATEESFNSLVEEGFIDVEEDFISISFLNEQLEERVSKSLTNSQNGKLGGRPRKANKKPIKPTALISLSELKANQSQLEEKRREEKREEKKRVNKEKTACAEKEALFFNFWETYDKSRNKEKVKNKFFKLKNEEIEKIFETLPAYVKSTPDKKYRKDPLTYLNQKTFEDEIITNPSQTGNQSKGVQARLRENIENSNLRGTEPVDWSLL